MPLLGDALFGCSVVNHWIQNTECDTKVHKRRKRGFAANPLHRDDFGTKNKSKGAKYYRKIKKLL